MTTDGPLVHERNVYQAQPGCPRQPVTLLPHPRLRRPPSLCEVRPFRSLQLLLSRYCRRLTSPMHRHRAAATGHARGGAAAEGCRPAPACGTQGQPASAGAPQSRRLGKRLKRGVRSAAAHTAGVVMLLTLSPVLLTVGVVHLVLEESPFLA